MVKKKEDIDIKNLDDLVYNLIFSDENNYQLDISDYIEDIYKYEVFITHIRGILRRSKVKIINSFIRLDSKTVIWELKISK